MKIKISVDSWERETHREPGSYGDWESEGGINGVSARRAKSDEGGTSWDLDVEVGSHVFAVVAHYGTGDSFGFCSGGQSQVVGAWATLAEAEEARRVCELYSVDKVAYGEFARRQQGLSKAARVSERMAPALVVDGRSVYPYWEGYFESLNEIKVWLCRVEP